MRLPASWWLPQPWMRRRVELRGEENPVIGAGLRLKTGSWRLRVTDI